MEEDMEMEYETLILEKEGTLATIMFNRPEAMNILDLQFIDDLSASIADIEADDNIKAVIIWGGPKIFAAGGDLKFLAEADQLEMEVFIKRCNDNHDKIAASRKPYVAAIAGLALGGGVELALACDVRIAADNAIMGLPETNNAIIPGAGGTQRLPRVVGSGWAKHMILTGEKIDVQTAFKIGLVTKVVTTAELLDTARRMALGLAARSPMAIRTAKKCLANSENTDLPSALAYEQKAWALLFAGADQTEGMKAFLEKRKPVYTCK
jgi:enoyl-CoA hydratase